MCIWCFLLHHQETLSCTTLKLKKKKNKSQWSAWMLQTGFRSPFPNAISVLFARWMNPKDFKKLHFGSDSANINFAQVSRSFPRKKKKQTKNPQLNYRRIIEPPPPRALPMRCLSVFPTQTPLISATQPRPARREISKGNFDQSRVTQCKKSSHLCKTQGWFNAARRRDQSIFIFVSYERASSMALWQEADARSAHRLICALNLRGAEEATRETGEATQVKSDFVWKLRSWRRRMFTF